jgi:hypothetical protein
MIAGRHSMRRVTRAKGRVGLPSPGEEDGFWVFQVTMSGGACTFPWMKVEDIKSLVERQPFRPFTVRLNNGVQYTFRKPRSFGAPEDYHMVFFFGPSEAVRIDADSIVEIIEES